MTIFEKIEADMNAVEGTALEKLMESFYHTAMKYCNNPNKYLEDKLLYYFGISVDDYKCKDEKQLDEIGKDITVMLNALYLGKVTCATFYMKRILEKSRNVENSPVIIAFAKNVDMIIRSCMFTSPVLKAHHALIDEFHLFQHLSTITDIQNSLEFCSRDDLVSILLNHLFKKESDYPKDDPKPAPKLYGGAMIDSGFVKKDDSDKPTVIEPPTPSSTPSVDTISNTPRKQTSPYLPDIDAHAKVFVEQNNVISYLDEHNGIYWFVMEGIVQRTTSKKWSIYNTRYSDDAPCGYIDFFEAIDKFYSNVLIDKGLLFGWKTKLNTFISVLRANISYFRTASILDYVPSIMEDTNIEFVLWKVCDRIKQHPGIRELCISAPTEQDPFNEINRLYRLIAANYYNLVDITYDNRTE